MIGEANSYLQVSLNASFYPQSWFLSSFGGGGCAVGIGWSPGEVDLVSPDKQWPPRSPGSPTLCRPRNTGPSSVDFAFPTWLQSGLRAVVGMGQGG